MAQKCVDFKLKFFDVKKFSYSKVAKSSVLIYRPFFAKKYCCWNERKECWFQTENFDIKKSLNPRLLNLPLLPDIATSKWNGREKRPYQIDILKKLLYPKLTKLCSDCMLVLFKPCFPCCSAAVFIRKKTKNIKFIGATFFCI